MKIDNLEMIIHMPSSYIFNEWFSIKKSMRGSGGEVNMSKMHVN